MKTQESSSPRLRGVLSPVVTPFRSDLAPDAVRFARHCKWLLANGCSGLAVFGTNSEANSLSVDERMILIEHLVQDGVPAARLMPGTGCCSLTDSVRLTAHAVALGCAGALMLPPFYYKDVPEEGLYRNFSEVIERVGDGRLRMYLYHIPPVSQVGISTGLIERLLKKYPGTVAGIKDSSGDWKTTEGYLNAFAASGFDVFAGSEVFLLPNLRGGGVGCITATGNVNPFAINALYESWRNPGADALQAGITATRMLFQKYPMIPALKAAIAHFAGEPGWSTVRPPLVELDARQHQGLVDDLQKHGFTMPGLANPAAA